MNSSDSAGASGPAEGEFKALIQRAKAASAEAARTSPEFGKQITALLRQSQQSGKYLRQLVWLRKCLLWFILGLMTAETAGLFAIIILNALDPPLLKVEARTLQVLVGATIAQVSAMLILIIKSVFSDNLNQLIMSGRGGWPLV